MPNYQDLSIQLFLTVAHSGQWDAIYQGHTASQIFANDIHRTAIFAWKFRKKKSETWWFHIGSVVLTCSIINLDNLLQLNDTAKWVFSLSDMKSWGRHCQSMLWCMWMTLMPSHSCSPDDSVRPPPGGGHESSRSDQDRQRMFVNWLNILNENIWVKQWSIIFQYKFDSRPFCVWKPLFIMFIDCPIGMSSCEIANFFPSMIHRIRKKESRFPN